MGPDPSASRRRRLHGELDLDLTAEPLACDCQQAPKRLDQRQRSVLEDVVEGHQTRTGERQVLDQALVVL